MEKKLARIVNKGLQGEPVHHCFQVKETLAVIEFSQIKFVNENGGAIREASFVDNDIDNQDILHILNNMGHECEVSYNENNEVTLYF